MAGELTIAQRAYIKRRAKSKEVSPEDEAGELNIVPFLDIIMNILMFVLATITTVFTASISVPAPRASQGAPGHSPENDMIMLTVKVVAEGYIVAGPGGFLQPGCTSVSAAALTVPLQNGHHDAEGLTRCMIAVRNNPDWAPRMIDPNTNRQRRDIQIAFNGDVPYHVLIETLDALRETRPGANDLFDEPILGIL